MNKNVKRNLLLVCCMLVLATACGSKNEAVEITEDLTSDVYDTSTETTTVDEVDTPIESTSPDEVDTSTEATATTASDASTQTTGTDSTDTSEVDLTAMSSTMIYAEVYQMMMTPGMYVGRKVKMQGLYDIYHDDTTGKDYHSCIITDATACCAQGIEFELADGNYPGTDISEVTVEGIFNTYEENGAMYCTLTDAKLLN
ncbi:hypothetical protein [Butyrivibrio sp. INlla16]|uniref:hypothetical protein n=1 Tax=Butyrivibrio sp. INlla16 TaxID=1520807 RepID=UPI00087E2E72|nr:hypothetical protein [Butyrivibrio sp. INlla16]SDB08112.1 hypothetical protein SAMN02910263_00361 [Butyrivibrio sp. INlla16]